MDVLIDMDERLGLKEKISTAYEYLLLGKRSAFDELLFSDAAKCLRSIDKGRLFPFKFSFLHLSILFLILANILILLVDYSPAGARKEWVNSSTLNGIKEMIEEFSPDKRDIRKEKERENRDEIGRKFEDISKKIKGGEVSRQRIDSSVHEILREIESEKAALSRELASKVESENIEGISIVKKREIQKLSLYNLKKLEEMLNRMFDNRIPDSIGDDLALLKERSGLEDLLKAILNRMNMDLTEKNNPKTLTRDKGDRFSDETNPQETKRESGNGDKSENTGKSSPEEGKQEAESADSGYGEGSKDEKEDKNEGNVSKEGNSVTAGRGKAENRQGSPHEIKKTEGPALQDKTISSSGEDHILRIRSLTAAGEAKIKEEDIIRTYQREIESVISKEDIPLNYREYIKNYFLSINLRKEEISQ